MPTTRSNSCRQSIRVKRMVSITRTLNTTWQSEETHAKISSRRASGIKPSFLQGLGNPAGNAVQAWNFMGGAACKNGLRVKRKKNKIGQPPSKWSEHSWAAQVTEFLLSALQKIPNARNVYHSSLQHARKSLQPLAPHRNFNHDMQTPWNFLMPLW